MASDRRPAPRFRQLPSHLLALLVGGDLEPSTHVGRMQTHPQPERVHDLGDAMASRSSLCALPLVPLVLLMACSHSAPSPTATDPEPVSSERSNSSFLFVWAGVDPATSDSDFLAVVDADADSTTYGEVLSTLEVGHAGGAHHTDHFMPRDGELLANAFPSGRTYRFDLTDPATPRLAGTFRNAGPYTFPHSFYRLHNGTTPWRPSRPRARVTEHLAASSS